MLDIGWSELLLIGIVALIVVGPKDLPGMFRTLGRFTAKARAMGREFSRAMEEAAKDSGLDEATKDLRDLKSMTSKKSLGLDALDKAADAFEKWQPKVPSATVRGPETQALAERQREKAEARLAAQSVVTPPATAAAPAATPEPAAHVSRPVTRKSSAPKAPSARASAQAEAPAKAPAAAAAAPAEPKAAAKAPRTPRARPKGEA